MTHQQHPFPWKAAAPSLALSATLVLVSLCAAIALFYLQRSSTKAMERASEAFDAAVDLELHVREVRQNLTKFIDTGDDSLLADLTQMPVSSELDRVERVAISEPGRRSIAQVRKSLSNLNDQLRKLSAVEQEQRRGEALRVVDEILDGELIAAAREQRGMMRTALAQARIESSRLASWTSGTLLMLGLVGASIGILSGYKLAQALHHHLIEVTVSIGSASGSLEQIGSIIDPDLLKPTGDLTRVKSMVTMLSDQVGAVVTRLQAAEQESRRQDQLAALGKLATGLAHELRNPLTAIKTLIEACRDPVEPAKLDDHDLQVIEEELDRLDASLQSFLDYARPPQATYRNVDLRQVIQRTAQLVSARAEQQAIEIRLVLPSQPIQLFVDPDQLHQVLLNLVLNALDSIGSSGVITVRLLTNHPDQVCVQVDDTGGGIGPQLIGKLFDPFVSSKAAGTGLGLTICRRIVEGHRGTISAENLAGNGARFSVVLPRKGVPETESDCAFPRN